MGRDGMTSLLNEHLLLGATVAGDGETYAGLPMNYGNSEGERGALGTECGVADLSFQRMLLVSGQGASAFVSATMGCQTPVVGACAYGAVLSGDAAAIAIPLVVRTGDNEFLLLEGPHRASALDGWLRWLVDFEQDGVRPYDGTKIEDVTGSLVPILLCGPSAGRVLGDYLPEGAETPSRGSVIQQPLDGRILSIVVSPDRGDDRAYLLLVPPAYSAVIWRSLMSFNEVVPVGVTAIEGLAGSVLPWARLMRTGDRVTFSADMLERWEVIRPTSDFIGARALRGQ